MASALYDKGRDAFANKLIDWTNDSIKAVLVDTGAYTPNLATDQFLSDIPVGARISTAALANKSTGGAGIMDADDVLFTGVPNTSFEAIVIYLDTGAAGTSRLIAYIDNATGLPTQTNNGNVTIGFDNGANKIFKL